MTVWRKRPYIDLRTEHSTHSVSQTTPQVAFISSVHFKPRATDDKDKDKDKDNSPGSFYQEHL